MKTLYKKYRVIDLRCGIIVFQGTKKQCKDFMKKLQDENLLFDFDKMELNFQVFRLPELL